MVRTMIHQLPRQTRHKKCHNVGAQAFLRHSCDTFCDTAASLGRFIILVLAMSRPCAVEPGLTLQN